MFPCVSISENQEASEQKQLWLEQFHWLGGREGHGGRGLWGISGLVRVVGAGQNSGYIYKIELVDSG